ncbi:MAG: IPT/TIG domain-containing protein [Psychrobacillus sp.]|uniref:IPT/TIG domain-containing protein n=1 Tax=Solibacillus sp. FSL R7-0682 TaxID=2921690 RepID=UPI0030F50997
MKKNNYVRTILIVMALIISSILPYSASASNLVGSDLVNITKTVDVTSLVEGDIANVTISVKGTPKDSTYVRPNDVILIIDKSGSMEQDNRINAAKDATKEFIDLMDLTKHQVGIVDFASSAPSYPLTTDATAAKNYVDTIQSGGGTATGEAVRAATAMLANHRPEAQPTIVILTDGAANNTSDALASANAAKDAGIIFYSIALLGPNEDPTASAPNQLLKDMATSRDHHHFVLGSVGLSDVYKRIVEEIGLASAYNVKLTDTISPEFEIVPGSYDNNIPKPEVTGNTLEWNIQELKSKELTFTYQIRAKTTTKVGKYLLGTTSATFEDHQKVNYTVNTNNPMINVLNPAPIITSINPEMGLTTGGEEVTITGQNFLPGAKVYFGTNQATVLSESSNEIVVKTPLGVQGTVEVKVVNTDNQFAIGSFMYYADPTISYVTPAEGKMEGGNQVSVIGSNFLNGAKVYINGVEADTSFSTKAKLYVIVPESNTDGLVSVKVVNPDGTKVEKADAYNYLTPPPAPVIQLDSLSATSGKLTGGESIYLLGKNFDNKVKVYFGDKEAIVNYYANSSKIRVNAPQSDSEGFVTVKVVNPDGSFSELTNAYEYLAPPPAPAPEISYLSETSLLTGEQKTIYLFGNNIAPNAKVYLDDEEIVMDFVTNSKVRIKIPVSMEAKTVDVKLENPDGQSAILAGGFTYEEPAMDPAPTITSLSSNSGTISGGEVVTITGTNFKSGAKVYFGDKAAVISSIYNTEIKVKAPASTIIGLVSVKVVNADQQEVILNDGYNYVPVPITVTSLSVTSGSVIGGNLVTVYGTNFNNLMTVTVDGQEVAYTYLATNRIRIKMPTANAAGTVDITVGRAGAQASIQYTYN